MKEKIEMRMVNLRLQIKQAQKDYSLQVNALYNQLDICNKALLYVTDVSSEIQVVLDDAAKKG